MCSRAMDTTYLLQGCLRPLPDGEAGERYLRWWFIVDQRSTLCIHHDATSGNPTFLLYFDS